MRALLAFLFFLSMTGIAIAQAAAEAVAPESSPLLSGIFKMISNWEGMAQLMAFAVALQVFLRGLAEALTRISDYTDTKWDNKIAAFCSEASWFLGAFIGKLGYGTPKLVVEEIKSPSPEPAKVEEKK